MTTDIGPALDTAAKSVKLVGDLATAAATIGPIAITIAELVLPWIPGLGPVVSDIQVAIPIIKQIAAYAPQVQAGLQNGKPMIQAVISIGEAILGPLGNLSNLFPGVSLGGIVIDEFLRANEFTPQDPRFQHGAAVD